MNRMIGITLIIIGIIVFVTGVVVYNSSTKRNEKKSTKSEINKQKETKNEIDSKSNELDKVIKMAIADGIITNNERKLIKKIATEQGLDYNEVIKNAERKLSEKKNRLGNRINRLQKEKGR